MERQVSGRRDLRVTGTGSTSGGTYQNVRLVGEGSVDGHLECQKFRAIGTFQCKGDVHAEHLRVVGTVDVDGTLYGGRTRITGELSTTGDCSADVLEVRGTLRVGGLVNADRVDIRLYGPARCTDIGGGVIRIRPSLKFRSSDKGLSAETIEGDEVHLRDARVQVVRGKRVWIGPGCEIGRVEYTDELHEAMGASITESQRV